MADNTILKYVSLANLQKYDEKIKEHIAAADATLKTNLEGQVGVVAGALDGEIARAKAAEQANAAAAQAAQTAVDTLAGKVGTVPENQTVMGIITNIQENAYDDTEIRGLISGLDTNKADKTQVAADIAAAVKVETDARVEAVAGVQGNVDTLSGTHAADKKALEDAIALKAAQTALDKEVSDREAAVSGLQTQINTIMSNPDAEGAINSINEFTAYVTEHGAIADGFRTDINKNKDDIAAMDTAYKAADEAIQGRLDNLEAIDHNAYVAADTALKNELNTEIGKKANSADVTSAVQTLEAADAELSGRLDDVEAALGTGDGSVSAQISDAKQEAIDAAAADAASKDTALETSLKSYVDAEDEKIKTRVASLETASATHALASDLTALAGRVTTAEGEIDTLQADLDAAEVKIAANETAISGLNTTVGTKAAQSDLDNAVTRIATLETWHENFEECTEDDINSLFTV